MTQPVVETTSGAVLGVAHDRVQVFRGVPFAAPPVGALRYAPPQPVPPWPGVREAVEQAEPALQFGPSGSLLGSEDCLYLNVFAPATPGPHPVLVWIHGGGGVVGGTAGYDGSSFARNGVVLVTVAYRLGLLGFLQLSGHLGDVDHGNNCVLADLVAALRWVRDNIGAFGGDPGAVTVAGHSNGGRLVATLLAVPQADGLFGQAIVQSGTAAGYAVYQPSDADRMLDMVLSASDLGRHDVAKVRELPARSLMATQQRIAPGWRTSIPYLPVVDGSLLPERPIDAIVRGAGARVRVVAGTTHDEQDLSVIPPILFDDAQLAAFVARCRPHLPVLAESDRRRYVGSWANQQLPTTRLAEALAKAGRATWVYRVDLRLAPQGLGPGAPHGVDVPLIFGDSADMGMLPAQPHGPVERHRVRALAGIMHAAWVRFIAGGTPGGGQLPEWPRYEPDRRPVMLFDAESRVVDDPDGAIRAMCPDQLRLIAW